MATAREVAEQMRKKKEEEKKSTSSMSARQAAEQIKKYNSLPTDSVDQNYISSFVSEANSFLGTSKVDNSSYGTWKDLSTKADTISGWLYKNRGNLKSEDYDSIANAINTFSSATKDFAQFDNEDSYIRNLIGWLNNDAEVNQETASARQEYYNSQTARAKEIDESLPWYVSGITPNFIEDIFLSDKKEALRDEMETLNAENNIYKREQGKLDSYYIPETEEFKQAASNRNFAHPTRDELSAYDSSISQGSIALNDGGYFDENDNIRDKHGNIVQYAESPITDKLGMYHAAKDTDIAEAYNLQNAAMGNYSTTWADLLVEGDQNEWGELSDYEIELYYYYLNTEGKEKAFKYLEDMAPVLTKRATQKRTDAINNTSGIEQVALNIASIPANVFGGAIGFADDVANFVQGKEINPYSRAHMLSNVANDIRTKTAADIDEWTGGASIPWIDFSLGDAYQAGMSGLDSLAGAYLLGGTGYGVLMGMGAASAEMKELYEKGASTGQMLVGGVLAGAAEMIFEKYSIDKFLEMGDTKSIKDILVNILKQGGVEASEEAFTEIANTISDVIVMGSQSDWVDAETFIKNVVNAGIGGFISGGGMGGLGSVVNYGQYNQQVKKYGQSIIDKGGVESLQATASEMSDNKTVSKLSNKVAEKTTAKNVGRLATTIQNITNAKDRATIAIDLESNGLSKKEAQKVADFTVKISQGYKPTSEEIAEIERITDKLPDVADMSEEGVTDTNVGDKAPEVTQVAELPSPVEQASAQAEDTAPVTENAPEIEIVIESEFEASGSPVESGEEESTVTLADASKKYGAQAQAMIHTYTEGQNVEQYDNAYSIAYNMGMSGVSLDYAKNSDATAYLSETQRELAYEAGKAAADTSAKEQDAKNKALVNGKTGRRKGVVKGEGVTIADLKASFNDTQNMAYKVLSVYAEATGVDIVLYKSEADAEGNFIGAQGKFKWSEDKIYIDVNAGLSKIKDVNDLAKYAMIRTFSHEFTHFIEKWNPIWYNEFRKAVFDTLTERGENVHDLIETKMSMTEGMTYEKASREVVAEAMTDILPDANFVETLATKNKNIFDKLLEKLKEFLADLKAYFKTIGHNPSREANALKEQVGDAVHYVDNIVKLFDKVALEAVENYQATVATEEVAINPEKIDSTVTTSDEKIDSISEESTTENAVDETVTETVTETTDEVDEKGEGDAFTITDNAEYGTLEIKFDGKPSEAVRNVLKEHKFRWHKVKGVWYGKGERADIVKALQEAYKAEDKVEEPEAKPEEPEAKPVEEKTATDVLREMGGKAVSDNMTDVTDLFFPALATTNNEEANQNGENADNGQTVLGSDPDGERAPRSLDEQQAEDVSGAASERNAVEDPGQRESETGRDGDRADESDRLSRSDGDGESGDLRELTEQETQAKAEELAETVEREIEQKSTEQPKGSNFVIGDSLNLPNGDKARFRANVDAIRLIKQLETEGRFATAAEQEILSKYVGWGGLSNAFGDLVFNRETRKTEMVPKDEWKNEFAELKALVDEGIITEQEYKSMSESTKNAHYTSVEVIKAMYDGLASLGFKGGRMLEPSAGVGNFVGAMPADMTAKVNSWTMVEIERVTGLISKYLYPNSDVRIQGFENANIPDNYMDVAIGNVPFGNYGVVDKTYPNRITKAIHNYFFAKSIDKVRPGGIVMFVTSSFTMNAKDSSVRQYIMERADLLGAIRLPNTAFKGNAGTDVVTDILILKKRESGTAYAGEDFLEADYDNTYGTYVSNYFKNHPEMVLGKPVTKRGMYGAHTLTFEPFTDRGTIDDQIREAFKNIKGKMDYPTKLSPEKTNFAVEKATKKSKAGGFVVNTDGSISRNENGKLVKYDTDEKTAKRIAGILSIRDAYKTLSNYLQQGQDAKYIKQARKALNEAYDKFVKEYGPLNSPANKKAIDSDPDRYSILSLENYDAKGKTAKKADIFTKDTISANKTITHVDSVEEGVIASINLTGGVDTALIAKLTDKTVESVTRDIIDARLVFKTRNGTLIARESYLSGNVRAKLREAEALAPYDQDFNHNVEELRKVIPADIPYNEIYITPGATFIPNEVYADFIAHMLGGRNNQSYGSPDVEVGRTTTGEFKIILNNKRLKNNYYNTQTWGTARKSFLELIDAMMGSRTVRVNDTVETSDGRKVSVLNEAETEAANEKVKAIQQEFEDWIWKDENRRKELARLYNETFNAIVNPKYDGSHLSVNGISTEYSLRPHQANAVHRIISSGGNTLLAHRVGAGKTLEMAAAAMKMRELGVIKKPVFVVPKNVVAQWGVEFHSYFPAARILVADDKSFTPANRKIFTNQIANGDYDAVIVSYEQFEKIPMSAEYQARFYEEQINEIIAAIAEEKAESRDGKGLTVKEMEKKKAQLEKKLKELTSKPKDENNIDFEMLGIDSLFVDEAHNFKNLEYVSKMSNVAGLGSAKGAQRSFDLYTKIRYLQGLNGGRGVVFATATPVMNSMVELYIMQRYLQPDVLNQLGLKSFDAWAKQFGEVVNKWEINPSGTGMRQKQVFANFRNLNELQLLFRSFADVLTEVPGLKIPKMKGGAVKIIECEPGEFQKNYMQELQKRAENVKNVDPKEDNMLKITSDGRKVSYTQRMIDPTLPYEPESKIFKAAENVLKEYQESADIKGTQIVFLDMATPKGADKSKAETTEDSVDDGYDEESARLYDDMRDYLVKKGIPKREIAFIHEATTDAKRKQLFEDVNSGKVRVLMGSTGKMGVGMNAQKRVVAIHHLDAPWRPGDVEQRDGRAFRQKNINEEVSKYVYVTKGSFDSRLWDILDRKQHFINQIMNGEDVGRIAEDTGEVTLSAAEVKALASGNPLIEEQTKLTDAIKKLENLQKAYNSSIVLAKTKLSDDEATIANYTNRIARIREDIKARVDTYSEGKFSMTVGKQVFTDKKDAGVALAAEIAAKANANSYATIGKFAGFELRVIKNGSEYSGLIHGKEGYRFNVYMNNTTRMVNHIGEVIAGFENMIKNAEQMIDEATADRDAQKNILAQPFEKRDELAQKRARFNEVMELLAPKNEQQHSKMEDDTVQEQSRAYLSDSDSAYMEAVESGDMETAQKLVNEAADRYLNSLLLPNDNDEVGFKYHRGKTPTKTFKRYAVFNVSEDGFRAAYAGNKNATPVGVWLDAQNLQSYTSDMVQFDDGSFASYIPGDTGAPTNTKFSPDKIEEYGLRGGQRWLLERGGKHSSDVPNFSQMNLKVNEKGEKVASGKEGALPHNKLVFEIEYGISDDGDLTDYVRENGRMMKGKNQGLAKINPNQYYDFKTNPNAVGNWGIGGTFRITRIVPHDEIVSVTHKYKQDSIAEANRLFDAGEISKSARDARIKNANAIQVQKWVGGYDPSEFGITEDSIQDMVAKGRKMKLTDAVTYDDNGEVIPLSQRFNVEMDDIRYQQRTETLTDREVLELAANEVKVSDLTQAEKDALTIFQDRLSNLKDLQEERAEQGRLYKEQQFGEKVDRAKAAETLNRMHILDDQIKKATAEVLTVEEKEILKRVLQKARKVVEVQEREHGKEILNRWRDRRNNAAAIKKYRDRLRGDVDDLSNWILHPNNKDTVKHVPDVLKNTVIPFLSSINFMSKRALNGGAATKADEAFMTTLKNLQGAIKTNIDTHGLYSGYNDLPSDFMDRLDTFIKSTEALVKNNSGELVINQMTSAELKELSQVVRTLKKYIMQFNSFHYNAMYQHVYEAGENSIQHLTELGDAGNTGAVSTFLLWQQIRPAYAFERFGNGGIAIYDGLRRGQAKLAFNTKEIQAFTEKAYTEKEVKAWEEEIKTFRFGAAIVKMPVSYIMSFYELSKDPEALAHINGEGIRVATYTHKGKKISDTGHILTLGEFTQIIGSLTDRQKQVADSLQKYMATQGAKWGNYVSVARFGEELFTNPKYFPINSDGRHLQANTDEHPSAAALYALLNMSFTKSRKEGANNRIMIYSIFDVFANHMASMAQYNAMALPILDALKWFNYQQVFVDDEGNKQKGESVRERMDRAYGVPEETRPGRGKSGYAQDFVMNIIKAFNGTEAQGTPFDSFGLKPLHRYNVAQVAYNLRVVVQQPLAITRAGMLLDYSSILKGMKLKPSEIKKNIEEMQKYSGIAAWKSLGFYDVNISRGLTHIIKHDSTFMDKVGDIGMWGAEKADLMTWAAIWSACKVEVVKKQLAEKDGFYEAVTKLFEDVIYKTQVVDSILTKNEFMRDKGTFARLVGSFMSEPSTNASMLIDAYDQYALDMQRGMTRQQAWKKNSEMIGRRLYVYAVGAILLAAVQAAADALRDDDDYEEWYEKYLEAFGGNLVDELMPFNKLPILSDFYDLAKELLSIVGVDTYGNPPQSVFMQWYESLVNGTEIIYQKISGEDTNYTWYSGIYKLLQAASGITGLPMASATREIITAWNNIVGAMAPSLKIKTYEPSELSQIRYAYEDGYLTYEEATAQLLEQGLADNENDAYFIMQGWEAGDDYSRYDAIYDAVRNGASIDADMAELTSHGYTEEEVLSQVKTKIGKWYKDGEISKQQATNMLTKYFGMDSSKINATLSYWEYKATNPDTEVYVDWFEKYYSDVSASGMSLNEYLSYKNKVKDITGEDKKARRMAVINSLPITNAQKDALYFAEGWAESKLYEAPWH